DITLPVREAIPRMLAADDAPSISRHMETTGTCDEMVEFLKHRSAYQLKEADPHTFAIPHLSGRAKQILAAIQAGEYGADEPDRMMHSALFAQTMRAFGLDDRPNAYLDELPASALMISNLISYFGLHRSHRGRLVGHLAVFEMTSVVPMGRYGRGLERMGAPAEARRFYDVHVLADAEHERMALEMADALENDEPSLRQDILFGAQCVLATERLFATRLLGGWARRRARHVAA
ncbi:MAG: iron-containing redox enzyme family protein, partial [Actinobacteria bacterium]|nr:iron-containing redox enzyme family protein [Actinomycetota bacterium]